MPLRAADFESAAYAIPPLRAGPKCTDLDDGRYAYSWYEPPSDEPSLAGVTSHL